MSEIVKTPQCTHYAKKVDDDGNFMKWIPKPDKEGRSNTSTYSIKDICEERGFDFPFCFFCGRTKEQLGKHESLTRDHIKELCDGGDDTLDNLQILCTACHKLKNWNNTYVRRHLVGKEKRGEDE